MQSASASLSLMTSALIPSPPRGAISWGPLTIHFYALCIVAGVLVGFWLTAIRWRRRGGRPEDLIDVILIAFPLGIIGARFYHVCTDYQLYFGPNSPHSAWDALKIWEGGLGIWGGIAVGVLTAAIVCHRRGLSAATMADAAAPGLLVAQGIGRLGNWFNQELYGGPTSVPWGLEIFQRVNGVSTGEVVAVVHPTFLYEMLWDLSMVVVLLILDHYLHATRGRLFASYVMLYCFGRFWVELLRVDPAHTFAGLRLNNWVSLVCFTGAIIYLVVVTYRCNRVQSH